MTDSMTIGPALTIGGNKVEMLQTGNILVTSPKGKMKTLSQDEFKKQLVKNINNINKKGYGIFYNSNMFTLDDRKNIIPAKHQDMQNIKQLYGYERERSKVIQNTKALLEGKKANNILLYGDAGTGKSSTIKAISNMFKDDGLRLIEVKKDQLSFITDIIEDLSYSPLKFIIFIDDLTFSSNDDTFSYLKAILEGGVNSFPTNVVVYVTSNYRHLIKENFRYDIARCQQRERVFS